MYAWSLVSIQDEVLKYEYKVLESALSENHHLRKKKRLKDICVEKNIYRSSHRRCSLRKGVFRNFAKFTGKQLCQILFFDKKRATASQGRRTWERGPEGYRPFNFESKIKAVLFISGMPLMITMIIFVRFTVFCSEYIILPLTSL